MADEKSEEKGASEANPKEEPEVQTVTVDGKVYSAEEIRELALGSMREKDYRQKTMALAESRKALEKEQRMFTDEQAAFATVRETSSSSDDDLDLDDPAVKSTKTLTNKVDRLISSLEEDRKARRQQDTAIAQKNLDNAVDTALDLVEKLVKDDGDKKAPFPLASITGAGATIENFYHQNGRLPDSAEITNIVKRAHREIESRGVKVFVGEKGPEDSEKPSIKGGAAPAGKVVRPSIQDDDATEDALVKFMTESGITQS